MTLTQFAKMPPLETTADAHVVGAAALLERDEPLAALSRALELASDHGRLVAVCGEAGIGKSSLLEEFARRERANAEFLWGGCDALKTPSPLGPLIDIAAALGGQTAEGLLKSMPRHALFAAFVDDLARRRRPTVVVFEDVHWADEATLDLLKYAGRRIDRTHALLVITWRDDEVDLDHPIQRIIGDWRPDSTLRLRLRPLSVDAVAQLAAGSRDALDLHAVTGGNPFFVTEVLGAGNESVPVTVRDAVLARRARLGADARAVLDFVSIVPSRTEIALLEKVLHPPADAIECCVAGGLLKSEPHAVTFRHELARMAVANALPAPRAHHYHRLVLDALLASPDRSSVLARIVHHAQACDDVDAIVEFAPVAARQAACLGAHCQALQHYRRALEHRDRLPDQVKAELLENYAYEYYVTGNMPAARDLRGEALALWTRLGVTPAIGRNVRWLSRLAWFLGDRAEAERCAIEAIDVLTPLPETEELAMAFSNRSQLDMLSRELEGCETWGMKAIELARRVDSAEVLSHALNNVGTARANSGEPDGFAQLEQSLDLALAHDMHEHAARALTNLVTCEINRHHYAAARRWLQRGLAYTSERDLDAWGLYLLAWRAKLHAETGSWSEACQDAQAVLGRRRAPINSRLSALAAAGLVHVRRGDADARAILDDALTLARPAREPQRLIPILTVRAELAWLSGQPADVVAAVREAFDGLHIRTLEAERLEYRLWKAGASAAAVEGNGPYARLMRGDWKAAATYWAEAGCPYEEAEALIEGDLAAATRALEIFQTLGAAPAVGWARRRLRELGARRIPRGRRATTRAHPAGLTTREREILALLANGLPNPQIAAQMFVSRKTVEHHVSSILGKLNVPSRDAAVSKARDEGWV